MPRLPTPHPTQAELEILKILWRQGPATVRQVRERLAKSRDLAHTTVITMMNIMVKKGYLRRAKDGGSYHAYHPRITEQATTSRMVKDLVDRAFDGSAIMLMLNLLERTKVDPAELKELRKTLSRKAKGE